MDAAIGMSGFTNISQNLIINNYAYDPSFTGRGGGIFIGIGGQSSSYTTSVTNNTLCGCETGITFLGNSNVEVVQNNIFANEINFFNARPNSFNASYNWWGTTDSDIISQTISDYYDNFDHGIVTYSPYLLSPTTIAPTYVNASAGNGGTISSSGLNCLNYGGSQTFTITPDSGYHIADVLVNGTSIGAVTTYTVEDIRGATTIEVSFAADPTPTPVPTTQPTSNPTSNPTQAPTPTPEPTTAVPEFSSITLIVLLLIALTVATLFYKRRTYNKPV